MRSGIAGRAGLFGVATLAIGCGSAPSQAQTPLDYFFGRPGPRYYQALPRRLRPFGRAAEIPLPVPRPHFPGDAPVEAAVPKQESPNVQPTEKSSAANSVTGPVAPTVVKPPDETSATTAEAPPPGSLAPLPPVKPFNLAKPDKIDPEAPKPAAVKPATPDAAKLNEAIKSDEAVKSGSPAAGAGAARVDVPPPPGPVAPVPPPKPADLKPDEGSKLDSSTAPDVAPSGARLGEAPGQPLNDAACPGRLKAHNVEADPVSIGPQPDPRCTVVEAVRFSGMTLPDGAKVVFPDRPTIACTTAETFSTYVRELLAPLAKGTFGAPLTAVWTGPGLECRSRDHIFGAKLSAHGQGLAIDIAQLKLGDTRMIEVGTPKTDQDQGFETAARAAACGYFHTVLGPGSDSYHRNHWHFDLEVRGAHGDSKYCK